MNEDNNELLIQHKCVNIVCFKKSNIVGTARWNNENVILLEYKITIRTRVKDLYANNNP